LALQPAVGENWPSWRGPDSTGTSPPIALSDQVAWSTELPGRGSSTPIVWEDHILLTAGIDGKDTLLCFDRSGGERWRTALGKEREARHRNASGSNPSPVTDGESVFAYFKSGTVAALDLKGDVRWTINLQQKFGEDTLWWDLGTSPVLAGGHLVIAVMQAGDCYLVALDETTGAVIWKQDRTFDNPEESDQAYTTPVVAGKPGEERILVWGSDHVTAHDAKTGETLWTCGGFNPEQKRMWRAIASAVVGDGMMVVPYGRGKFLAGIRLGGRGDVTETHRAWERQDISTEVPTPIVVGDRVYILSDRGRLSCLDLHTGTPHWSTNLPKGSGKYFASPLLAGTHLYCAREDGVLYTGTVHPTGLELLSEHKLGESIIASPVPLGNQLLVRSNKRLICIGP
jgi:outer membrane protein assembly factor BamB